MTRLTLRFFESCPNWRTVDRQLRELAAELDLDLHHQRIDSDRQAARLGFVGSPTVLIDGQDPFPSSGPAGLSCRLYRTEGGLRGSPPIEEIREALRQRRTGG
jgi:hypothetical protein